jgi:hypothetical protein
MKNFLTFESFINEAAGFKNTKDFEAFLEEIDSMPEAKIREIMKGDYVDTPGFYSQEKDADIIEFMIDNMGKSEFEKLKKYWETKVKK